MNNNTNSRTKKRLVWLDLLKGFSMILIVLSHSGAPHIYARFYTPVFLSAFFFASGYTFNCKNRFIPFVAHKLRTLGIPFFSLGIINSILAIMVEHDDWKNRIQFIISRRGINDDLWFIACLFSTQLIFYAVVRVAGCWAGTLVGLVKNCHQRYI